MKYNAIQLQDGDWFVSTRTSKGQMYGRRFSESVTVRHYEYTGGAKPIELGEREYSAKQQADQYALYVSAEYYANKAREAFDALSEISEPMESDELYDGISYFDIPHAISISHIMTPC